MRTGINNPRDLMWSFLKACVQMEEAPDLSLPFDPVPVDYVSRAIVHLSRQPESLGKAFHFFNPRPVPWREVFAFARSLGYPLRALSTAEWERRLAAAVEAGEENALSPFWPLFGGRVPAAGDEPAAETGPRERVLRFDDATHGARSRLLGDRVPAHRRPTPQSLVRRPGRQRFPARAARGDRVKIKFYAHSCSASKAGAAASSPTRTSPRSPGSTPSTSPRTWC